MVKEIWHIEMLGGWRAVCGTHSLTGFKSTKIASLLAYLAFYATQSHSREELQALLWPSDDLEVVRNRLRVGLSSLRRQLEPVGTLPGTVLFADRTFIHLQKEAFTTDTAGFESAVTSASQAAETEESIARLTGAVEAYGGPLLPGFYEEWIISERERLAQSYLQILRRLTHCLAQSRDYERALHFAHIVTHVDPLREEAYRDVIRLYMAIGQPSAALQQYEELKRNLAAALGAQPALSTQQIARQIHDGLGHGTHQQIHSLASNSPSVSSLPSENMSAKSMPAESMSAKSLPPENLPAESVPVYLTRFFGREEELQSLCALLTPSRVLGGPSDLSEPLFTARLVTLTGLGGNGKTRLAVSLAQRLGPLFSGKIWFVPLADLLDANLLANAIIDTLQLTPAPQKAPLRRIADAISHSPALLILDNFEHLVEAGTAFVVSLLASVPNVVCLVTSRRPLEIPGEREFPVAPLPIPEQSGPLQQQIMTKKAIQAGMSNPAASKKLSNPSTLTSLQEALPKTLSSPENESSDLFDCPSVQLFLDRAQAARPEFRMTESNIADIVSLCRNLEGIPLALELAAARARVLTPAQMLTHLEHRFDLLVDRRAEKDARHRSLRSAIEWSYRLLPVPLRRLFAQLSIFAGGWSLQAAQVVCGEEWETHLSKAAEILAEDSTPWLLDELERLCSDSLIAVREDREEMRFHMLETLREFAREQLPPAEMNALTQRYVSYFVALTEEARPKLKGPQQALWLARLQTELDNLRAVFELCVSDVNGAEMGLRMTRALERYWIGRGLAPEGREWSLRALAHPGAQAATPARVNALIAAGTLYASQDNYAEARVLHLEAVEIAQKIAHRSGEAWALDNLGTLEIRRGNHDAAQSYLDQSLALHIEGGDKAGIAAVTSHSGSVAQNQENYTLAKSLYLQSKELHDALGDRLHVAVTLNNLGMIAERQGENKDARGYYEKSLTIQRELNNLAGIASAMMNLGVLAAKEPDYAASQACFSEALALARNLGLQRGEAITLSNMGHTERAQGNYEAACACYEESLTIQRDLENRSVILNTLIDLGQTHIALKAPSSARAYLEEALTLGQETGDQAGITRALEGLNTLTDSH